MTDTEEEIKDPWTPLAESIETDDANAATALLESLDAGDTARVVDRLNEEQREKLMVLVEPEQAADLLEQMHDAQVVDIVDGLEPEKAADIIEELSSDARADLLGNLEPQEAENILNVMEPEQAAGARQLLAYDAESAGGLMRTEFLAYPETAIVRDVVEDLRKNADQYSDYDVQYAYIVDGQTRLVGVLRLRDLLLNPSRRGVADIMLRDPISVHHDMAHEELSRFFDGHQFIGVPVIDDEERLIGVVQPEQVEEASTEAAADNFLKISGLSSGEELRSMPLAIRSWRRLSWLSVNIGLNVMAASVIAMFQGTLEAVIALAVFLPIISDMSGCSGSQAVAVSIRELTLGLVRPWDLFRVLLKELQVGLINGLALGILLALVALLWKGNPWLGLVVGAALMINTVVAVCLGGMIPLLLKRFDRDPALASGPILTTVTDMCGFMLVLGFATLALERLT
jgi:magnesium transporter